MINPRHSRSALLELYSDARLDEIVASGREDRENGSSGEVYFFVVDASFSPKAPYGMQRLLLDKEEDLVVRGVELSKQERENLSQWEDQGSHFVDSVLTQFDRYVPMEKISAWMARNQIWEFATLTNDRELFRQSIIGRYRCYFSMFSCESIIRHNQLLLYFYHGVDRYGF